MRGMTKKICYVFVLFIITLTSHAQFIERQVIGNAGTTDNTSGIYMDWNIGESIVSTEIGNTFIFTQGFEQPGYDKRFNVSNDNIPHVVLYPNPFSEGFTIMIAAPFDGKKAFSVIDMAGHVVYYKKMEYKAEYFIDLHNIKKGMYIFLIYDNARLYFKNKLIKK